MNTQPSFKRPRTPWPNVLPARRRIMQANKPKDTQPELHLHPLLHALSYRVRLHRRNPPGRPDLLFPSHRTAIHVHGCF